MDGANGVPETGLGVGYRYSYSGWLVALLYSAGISLALFSGLMLAYLRITDPPGNAFSGHKGYNLAVFGLAFAIQALSHAERRGSCWQVALTDRTIALNMPINGRGPAEAVVPLDTISGMLRPANPKRVVITTKDREQVVFPISQMSAEDRADFIVRLREVMTDRFAIPEDW